MTEHHSEQAAYGTYLRAIGSYATTLRTETATDAIERALVDCQATKRALEADRRLRIAPNMVKGLLRDFSEIEGSLRSRISPVRSATQF